MDTLKHIVEPHLNQEPEIGRWIWVFEDARRRTLEQLDRLEQKIIDWQPPEGGDTIGTILYHIAAIEADWVYAEVLQKPFPEVIESFFPNNVRDENGRLTQLLGITFEEHLVRLAAVREAALSVFRQMDLADFRRIRSLPEYDVTPEWVLHHLMQHEAEHRSQIGGLKDRAELALF
jgi:uncharacterized damage-inducible protein DinB